jgi:hypothetical protein
VAGGLARGFGLAARFGEFGRDLVCQPVIAGEAEEIIHPVGLAPIHQLLARNAKAES